MDFQEEGAIDLTPLLDIVLVVLMVFSLRVVEQGKDTTAESMEEIARLQETIEDLRGNNSALRERSMELERHVASLDQEVKNATEEIDQIVANNTEQQQMLADSLAEFFQSAPEIFEEMTSEVPSDMADKLASLTDPKEVIKQLAKLQKLSQFFLPMEVSLKKNTVYVEGLDAAYNAMDQDLVKAKIEEGKQLLAEQNRNAPHIIVILTYDSRSSVVAVDNVKDALIDVRNSHLEGEFLYTVLGVSE
ncbi:MAG: hypothetical protein RLY93_12005 [Sumerlaeia bacterium]